MANRDLLKEAIADAKAVKETAIANAKAALEEVFTPRMQELFKAKLEELDKEELEEADEKMEEGLEEMYDTTEEAMDMEKMEEAKEVDEVDLEELLRELDELEMEESITEEMMEGEEDLINNRGGAGNLPKSPDMVEEKEEEEEEEIDIENMDEDDLKKFIESVIADMVTAGELEGNIESEEGEEEEGEEEESEEEVKIDERKMEKTEKVDEIVGAGTDFLELADTLGVSIDAAKYLVVAGGLAVPAILAAIKVGGDKAIQFFKKMAMKKSVAETEEMEEMKSELEEAYSTIKTIKTELQEVNLFNAKLLYTNKIFKAKNLTESQKVKVLAAFDKAASVKEAKLVFETLSEGFKEKKILLTNHC